MLPFSENTTTPAPALQTHFREAVFSGYRTGALDILMGNRRVISVPSQLGCTVGCSFCISQNAPLVRNLSAGEMLELIRQCLTEMPPDGRPIELSFTGEGEALLNWRNTGETVRALGRLSTDFNAVRYCFSGLGARKLLPRVIPGELPVRLQLSLHAARQSVRDRLIPRSSPLDEIHAALLGQKNRFSAIELNVVLQDGVNDSEEDLAALIAWGDPSWPVLLNPVLGDGEERVAARTDYFETALRAAGRDVKRYSRIGARISRERIYPLMSARALSR
jgi:23S rRNA (adenine2503-C2)-methyltransferase